MAGSGLSSYYVTFPRYKQGDARAFYQQQYDAVFQASLLRTSQLAPWEPHVQRSVARVGLSAWDAIPAPAQRQLIADTIQRGLQLDEEPMRALIGQTGRRDQLCAQYAATLTNLNCAPASGN